MYSDEIKCFGGWELDSVNRALLEKWLWCYAMKREDSWRLVIDTKYDRLKGGWCSKEVTWPFGVGVWKFIRRGWETFSKFVRYEVGDGSNVIFWHAVDLVHSFFEMLYSLRVRRRDVDRICWSRSKRRKFEVKSYDQVLTIPTGSPFLWKSIVRVEAPSRVTFFVFKAALGKILTLDNLRKMNVVVVEWCSMCKKSGRSIYPLLIHCEVVRDL